jgi:hypothetical protein
MTDNPQWEHNLSQGTYTLNIPYDATAKGVVIEVHPAKYLKVDLARENGFRKGHYVPIVITDNNVLRLPATERVEAARQQVESRLGVKGCSCVIV